MNLVLAIAGGGALGSLARHFLSSAIYRAIGAQFPWGILVVNVLGGLAMGFVVELGALKFQFSPEARAFLTTGILGGFTTFSTFSLDTAALIQRGDWVSAAVYVIASVILSIVALFAAMWLVRSFG
jgi:CrcB protein